MDKALFVVEKNKRIPECLRAAGLLFSVKLINPESLSDKIVRVSSLIVVDVTSLTGEAIPKVKKALEANLEVPRFGLVQMCKRQDVVQAKALGLSTLLDVETPPADVIDILKKELGNYSVPVIPMDTPEATNKAVNKCCSALEDMAVSVALNKPLCMKSASASANVAMDAINKDGVQAWMVAVQNHHSHTYCHSLMVAGYSVAFAEEMGLSDKDKMLMSVGALVHDVGKLRIPLAILDKPGRLTPAEFEIIKKHPVFSREFLEQQSQVPAEVTDLAVHHHEYLDGSGYPDGLSADEICQRVRMLTICDIYSALTERRSYKDSFGPRQAYSIMLDMKDKLDQGLLQQFRSIALKTDVGAVNRKQRQEASIAS